MRRIKVTCELDNDDGRHWIMCYEVEFDNVAFRKEEMNKIHSMMGADLSIILSGRSPPRRDR